MKASASAVQIFTAHAPLIAASAAAEAAAAATGGAAGPLSGVRVSVKDLFDMKGFQTGFGSPAWLATHGETLAEDSGLVTRLRAAGASLVGKTQMDELAWSLAGENAHYGAPPNPAAPGRVTGGSSSGAAASVAAGFADVGVASDTGGSIRIPASHCGLYGLRPTHGRVSLRGARALAHSYDTAGFVAQSAVALRKAYLCTLEGEGQADAADPTLVLAQEMFDIVEPGLRAKLQERAGVTASVSVGDLGEVVSIFREMQQYEAWEGLGEWVTAAEPALGPGVCDRVANAKNVSRESYEASVVRRAAVTERLAALLGDNTFLVAPAAPTGPPLLGAADNKWRGDVLQLTSLAGVTGFPQIVFPGVMTEEGPVGLSIVGPKGSDERLLAHVCERWGG